jgi:hypothetical protein
MSESTTGQPASTNAPIGADPVQPASNAAPAEPQPIDLTDESLVRVKGVEKPVKFGEHVRGFQARFTQATQEAAKLRNQLAEAQRLIAEHQRKVQAGPDSQPKQASQEDLVGALKSLTYLSGDDAANMVQAITQQIQQRDQVTIALAKELLKVRGIVQNLHQQSTTSNFDSMINKVVSDLGYDAAQPGVIDAAKEIYLAYEGDDLNAEFPRIFGERMQQLEAFFEAKKRAAVASARKAPFVAGKGGQAAPSKPLEIKPSASAREIADQLWGTWNTNET